MPLKKDELSTAIDNLAIANKELIFQNEEKEKRAAELVIANKELIFQNEEKEKRAAELVIANKELIFQNEEKEKRAAELVIANQELIFQNEEKEKRAAELVIANKELIFQNEEKEKRAAELIIANKELQSALMNTVRVAMILSELRDPYTAGHERRVGELAVAISADLGFDKHRQDGMRVAGYLHDVGKMIIPAEILSKPGKLNEIEYSLTKQHPQAGNDVLKVVNFPWPIAEVALQHHEHIDGTGYPQGLRV
jgi:HD-GYP domain-containing protein (c-di-GMP phosphodiesterase class II)